MAERTFSAEQVAQLAGLLGISITEADRTEVGLRLSVAVNALAALPDADLGHLDADPLPTRDSGS